MFTNTGSVYRATECPCCRMICDHPGRRHGVYEYQAMPSLRDVAHDGWLCVMCTFTISWKFHQLAAGHAGKAVWFGKGRRFGPSITYKITPAGSLSSSQPGGPPSWTSPLAFGLIGATPPTLSRASGCRRAIHTGSRKTERGRGGHFARERSWGEPKSYDSKEL
jgi:hypothetical protein